MTIIAPPPVETTMQTPLGEAAPMTQHRFSPSPLNRRRWQNFKSNRRGYWSFWLFLILFFVSLFAEFIANDKPLFIHFDGKSYFPVFVTYPDTEFGDDLGTAALDQPSGGRDPGALIGERRVRELLQEVDAFMQGGLERLPRCVEDHLRSA